MIVKEDVDEVVDYPRLPNLNESTKIASLPPGNPNKEYRKLETEDL